MIVANDLRPRESHGLTMAFAQEAAPAQTDHAPRGGALTDPMPDNKASARSPPETLWDNDAQEALCLMLEAAAKANDLPLEFFARVIWQESRFQTNAVGPVTRSGKRAQGIAQFMPGTASERGLLDPFDPVQGFAESSGVLSELRNQFGNLGLAAAALQCRSAARAGLARRVRRHAAGDTQLRPLDYWDQCRGLGNRW